jgi:hypothetical protein
MVRAVMRGDRKARHICRQELPKHQQQFASEEKIRAFLRRLLLPTLLKMVRDTGFEPVTPTVSR